MFMSFYILVGMYLHLDPQTTSKIWAFDNFIQFLSGIQKSAKKQKTRGGSRQRLVPEGGPHDKTGFDP